MRLLAAAGASVALLLVPLASAATFGRPAEIPLSFQPVKVAMGDGNQDGLPDIVTANASVPSLTLFPGRGDGSFETPLEVAGAGGARALAFGDFDGDGAEELAVATPSAIIIYASREGTLVRQQSYPVPAPTFLATADLDSDGNLDIVATSATRSSIFVLHGRGDNTFDPPVEIPIGAPAAALVVADLNGDSIPDIAVAGPNLYELIGVGDGSFQPFRQIAGPTGLRAIAADDLDADGDMDLVAVGGPNRAYSLLNDGTGAFPQINSYTVGGTPVAVAVDDVNGDGSSDILTANRGTNDISILQGFGDGTFRSQTRVKVGHAPTGLAVGDLNSDGKSDVVVVNGMSKSVSVLLNGSDAPQPIVCLVPRVVHRTLAAARDLVARAHCALSPIRRKYSNRVKRNRVIAQSPVPGLRVPEGTAVTLVVSRGPKR